MQSGIAIALAWPETRCKQAGAWYDVPADFFGVTKDNCYKVGHSAIVLINKDTKKCHYFDFGRYHAPRGHGRVRDEVTDHDLIIKTSAIFNEELELKNYDSLLKELQYNKACHGDGQLFAGITQINFDKAYKLAKSYQNKGTIVYGPFDLKATNCSRFVRTLIINSSKSWKTKFRLFIPWMISPSPIWIVKNLSQVKKAKYKDSTKTLNEIAEECEIVTT
jgi:hypothetical protein